jgi:hypothetical protein
MGITINFRTRQDEVMAIIDVAKTGPEGYLIGYSETDSDVGGFGFTSGDPTKILPYEALVRARLMSGSLNQDKRVIEVYSIRNCDKEYFKRKADEDPIWARELGVLSLSEFSDRELEIFEGALKLRLDELLEIHERRRAQ